MNLFRIIVCVTLIAPALRAQVEVKTDSSPDKSATRSDVNVNTMDRTVVPLIIETKKTEPAPNITRTDSETKGRLNDGRYFDFRDTTTVQKQIDSNTTRVVQEIREGDRQGGTRELRKTDAIIQKTATGETTQEKQYRRNSSGGMELEKIVNATTVKRPDGSLATTSTEQSVDVSGNVRTQQQIEQTTRPVSQTEKQIATKVLQMDHMENRFKPVSQEIATVRTQGNTTRAETVVQTPGDGGWRNVAKITSTETRRADGTVQREIIEESQSVYSKLVPKADETLQPMRKILETEVRQPDGTLRTDRQVFLRDINGDWKQQSFSTEGVAAPTASPTSYAH